MKKVVLKLNLNDDKDKKKAMKTVSGLSGVESITMDMKDKKLTLTGEVDPVNVVSKLRKLCHTEIVSVGPAKEEKKKEEQPKKEEPKKQGDNKQQKDSKDDVSKIVFGTYWPYNYYPPQYNPQYNPYMTSHYHVRSAEEDPNGCVIC